MITSSDTLPSHDAAEDFRRFTKTVAIKKGQFGAKRETPKRKKAKNNSSKISKRRNDRNATPQLTDCVLCALLTPSSSEYLNRQLECSKTALYSTDRPTSESYYGRKVVQSECLDSRCAVQNPKERPCRFSLPLDSSIFSLPCVSMTLL